MGQVLASRGYSLDSLQLILSFRFLGILKYSQNIKTILLDFHGEPVNCSSKMNADERVVTC